MPLQDTCEVKGMQILISLDHCVIHANGLIWIQENEKGNEMESERVTQNFELDARLYMYIKFKLGPFFVLLNVSAKLLSPLPSLVALGCFSLPIRCCST